MMNSLFAKFNPGIEILATETLLAVAFPSKGPAPAILIGLLKYLFFLNLS